jgi:DNA-binding NarL/FixJ family response regulator
VAEIDRGRAALMYVDAGLAQVMLGQPEQALVMARRALDVSQRADGAAQLAAAVALAGGLALRGERTEAVRLLRDHQERLERANPLARAQELAHAGLTWTWLEGYDEAERLLDRLIGSARRAGALGVLPQALGIVSELYFRRGRWADARACAAESVRLAEETRQVSVYGLFFAGRLAAVQGEVEECRRDCRRILAAAKRFGLDILSLYAGHTLGLLALSGGHPEEAIERLEPVRRLPVASGVREPAAIPWVFDLVEAYIRSGRTHDAEVLLAEWAPSDDAAETWAHAASRRCRAMLADRDEMIDAFERALDSVACKDMPFERARTQLCFGERLRRSRQRSPARQQLRRALEIFEQLRAVPWAHRAEAELRATGETLTRDAGLTAQLTPQELQVALVVGRGASNQEAAAELFLSRKTIEYHLSNVYRKTNTKSRTQLAALTAGAT